MTEADVETIIQRAREHFPDARPRIISDNGPQFIAKDFKEFIRICGMTHVRTSPYYPQSNGKIETVAQDPQGRMHPGQDAVDPGGRAADRRGVRGALQRGPLAQRDRLRHAGRRSWPAATGDLRRAGPQAGCGARTEEGRPRGEPAGGRIPPSRLPGPSEGPIMNVARAEDRAPWRHDPSADPGAKTEGGRHDAALSFPFGIGTKAANRPDLFARALYLISRPRFLHFTLNHYKLRPRQVLNVAIDTKRPSASVQTVGVVVGGPRGACD